MLKQLHLLFLTLLPKNTVSRLVGFLADKSISKIFIPWFAKRYNIDLNEAEHPIEHYKTLNAFFTRHLKAGLRPVIEINNDKAVISPVDGKIAQYGTITNDRMIQAKGLDYSLKELLKSDTEAADFEGGLWMTIYLAPTDYHRIHHMVDGDVTNYRYIPGKLWPVNTFSVGNIRNLFPVNERLTTYYKTPYGPAANVKVGATVVGKIRTSYTDTESNTGIEVAEKVENITVKRGDECGLFAMGSTVVLLFPKGKFDFKEFELGTKLQLGQTIGYWK